MNKLMLLLVMLIAGTSAYAQKIETDDTESNGTRYIFCSKENVGGFSDKIKLFIGLGYMKPADGDGNYFLSVKLNCGEVTKIHKGGRMLIKTINGSVIELSTLAAGSDEMQTISGINIWTVTAQYPITSEQIQQLSSGISKVRIELADSKSYDKEWKKDKIGKYISKEYTLITTALEKDPKASFSEGF